MQRGVYTSLIDVSSREGIVKLQETVDSWRECFAAEKNAFEGGAASVVNHLEVDNHMNYQ